jgi:tRNA U38,U39,U40 pseudouridine synthase TruA
METSTATEVELSPAQKAFQFADNLNYLFSQTISSVPTEKYAINSLILEYLGEKNYKEFCKSFREANLENQRNLTENVFFKEEFADNPVETENILFDYQVKRFWNNSVRIGREIIKLIR